ncbi:MAG: hypothetical protein WAX38_00725 [Minisyncoccia bacterium]
MKMTPRTYTAKATARIVQAAVNAHHGQTADTALAAINEDGKDGSTLMNAMNAGAGTTDARLGSAARSWA